MKTKNKILMTLVFCAGLNSISSAEPLDHESYILKKSVENPKFACDFIYDHYPDTKFCTVIKNNSYIPLHLKRDDGLEIDLDPTISAVLFEKIEVDKRFFSITAEADNKMVYIESKNKAGVKCVGAKSKKSFNCLPW